MYLLAVVTLVASAIALGALLFDIVNIYLPDVTQVGSYYLQGIFSSLRMSLATLIIVFPIFAWLTRMLNKDLESNPERRESKIRKWLLYFTLFVSALFIIGDLVSVLRSFLNGELTVRFLFKSFIVLAIAGKIFYYYLSYLRWQNIKWAKILGRTAMGVVIVSIALAFYISGSPIQSRNERMDQARVSDLQNIQYQVVNYWQSKTKIPPSLNELNDSISGFRVPLDPETGLNYEYIPGLPVSGGGIRFELCAIFKTNIVSNSSIPIVNQPVGATSKGWYGPDNWDHEAGRVCFSRLIDPQLYPPKVQQ